MKAKEKAISFLEEMGRSNKKDIIQVIKSIELGIIKLKRIKRGYVTPQYLIGRKKFEEALDITIQQAKREVFDDIDILMEVCDNAYIKEKIFAYKQKHLKELRK